MDRVLSRNSPPPAPPDGSAVDDRPGSACPSPARTHPVRACRHQTPIERSASADSWRAVAPASVWSAPQPARHSCNRSNIPGVAARDRSSHTARCPGAADASGAGRRRLWCPSSVPRHAAPTLHSVTSDEPPPTPTQPPDPHRIPTRCPAGCTHALPLC